MKLKWKLISHLNYWSCTVPLDNDHTSWNRHQLTILWSQSFNGHFSMYVLSVLYLECWEQPFLHFWADTFLYNVADNDNTRHIRWIDLKNLHTFTCERYLSKSYQKYVHKVCISSSSLILMEVVPSFNVMLSATDRLVETEVWPKQKQWHSVRARTTETTNITLSLQSFCFTNNWFIVKA